MDRAEQSRRFEEAARAIDADGGFSPDEADKALDQLVCRSRQ